MKNRLFKILGSTKTVHTRLLRFDPVLPKRPNSGGLCSDPFYVIASNKEEEEPPVQEPPVQEPRVQGPSLNEVSFRARPDHNVHRTLGASI
jgi:hypothetical protein